MSRYRLTLSVIEKYQKQDGDHQSQALLVEMSEYKLRESLVLKLGH